MPVVRMFFDNNDLDYTCYQITSLEEERKKLNTDVSICFHYIECIRGEWYESRRGERISDNVNSAIGRRVSCEFIEWDAAACTGVHSVLDLGADVATLYGRNR